MNQIIYYAGIGSQSTPDDICDLMLGIAQELAGLGFVLRSGHADGADKAFEQGAGKLAQIFLPWPKFNGSGTDGYDSTTHYAFLPNPTATAIAAQAHPNWKACNEGVRKLHTRNVYQVLGPGLGIVNAKTASRFIVCWTKDGKASGGTGQAIRIAEACGIPVFNLKNEGALEALIQFVGELTQCTEMKSAP